MKQSVSSSTWNFANLRVTSTKKKMLGKKNMAFFFTFLIFLETVWISTNVMFKKVTSLSSKSCRSVCHKPFCLWEPFHASTCPCWTVLGLHRGGWVHGLIMAYALGITLWKLGKEGRQGARPLPMRATTWVIVCVFVSVKSEGKTTK